MDRSEQDPAAEQKSAETPSPAPLPGYGGGAYGVRIPVEIDDGSGGTDGEDFPEDPGKAPLKIFCYNCEQKLDVTGLPAFSVVDCPFCGASLIVPRWI
ncbi:MAG: hypothetical protein J6331_00395, partial [Lentisphaeria bacterium]|nr:hypothetical protein [Lentisphaeria bacterium]